MVLVATKTGLNTELANLRTSLLLTSIKINIYQERLDYNLQLS